MKKLALAVSLTLCGAACGLSDAEAKVLLMKDFDLFSPAYCDWDPHRTANIDDAGVVSLERLPGDEADYYSCVRASHFQAPVVDPFRYDHNEHASLKGDKVHIVCGTNVVDGIVSTKEQDGRLFIRYRQHPVKNAALPERCAFELDYRHSIEEAMFEKKGDGWERTAR